MSSTSLGGLSGIQSLLQNASQGPEESRLLSAQSSAILAGAATPLVALGAAGFDITRTRVNEALNIWVLVDTSGSMASDEARVTEGQNKMLALLRRDSRRKEMLVSQWAFDTDTRVIHPPLPVEQAHNFTHPSVTPPASPANGAQAPDQWRYAANGASTSLFTSWESMVAAAVAAHQFNETSPFPTPTVTICVVLTDGGENCLQGMARTRKAAEISQTMADLIKSERFIFAFMGADRYFKQGADPRTSQFWPAAKEMGFPDGCIGVDSDILSAFLRLSQSMTSVSQGKIQPGVSGSFF